ncbi:MAG: hypothetical protein LAN64_01725 [Acidobacteriia bacterium]|nr:hypothetical protein [Terriglobia bacterium]
MTCHPRALLCLVFILAVIAVVPPQAAAGVRLGGIGIGGGYARGLFYPPYYGYGPFYDPFWGPYPAIYPGYANVPEAGKVVLRNAAADAQVYIEGAYAGEAGKLKSLHLQPGVYNLEVRSASGNFERRIYVLSGKTLKIDTRSSQP